MQNIVDELPPIQLLFKATRIFQRVGDKHLDGLQEFIKEQGFSFTPIIDDRFHEFKDSDKKGWFVGSEFKTKTGKTHVVFTFGEFKTDEKYVFNSKESADFTDTEKRELSKKQKEHEIKVKAEREKLQHLVSKRCLAEWPTFSETFQTTEYTKKKGIGALHGARIEASSVSSPNIIVPMKDIHGKLWGYQTILDDGSKTFQPGQRSQGLFHLIGDIEDYLYICEGFATGVSVHQATGHAVAVSFNAGNLSFVAQEFRLKYPKLPIVICADDDCYRDKNVGVEKANEAAIESLCSIILPEFKSKTTRPTDFNDLHLLEGLSSVKEQFDKHKVVGPEQVIKTERSGFHLAELGRGGAIKLKPQYEDLRKFFERFHTYKMLGGSKICYVWDGKKYEDFPEIYLDNFAQRHFSPVADNQMCYEFRGLVLRTNLETPDWFQRTTERKINFQNGVLDIDTLEFSEHTPERGFRYVLNYEFDEKANCPTFDKFLNEVTQSDGGLQSALVEFMGYALSNDSCWAQKALILEGEGRNGKSTFINVLRSLAGKDNYTALTLGDLGREANRQMLDGKLFNIAEETPNKTVSDSSIFKNLVTGGETQVRQLYKSPYTMRNRAKMIFACNELPQTADTTSAFFRRFLIVPFKEKFSHEKGNRDPFMEEKLLKELPGIFNKAMEGYKRLVKNRQFEKSSTAKDALDEYQRSSDPVITWVEEAITTHEIGNGMDNKYNLVSDIYQEYARQMETNGFEPLNNVHFSRKLSKLIPDYNERMHWKEINGRRHRALKATTLYGAAKQ